MMGHRDVYLRLLFLAIKMIPCGSGSDHIPPTYTRTSPHVAEDPHLQAYRDNRKQIRTIN